MDYNFWFYFSQSERIEHLESLNLKRPELLESIASFHEENINCLHTDIYFRKFPQFYFNQRFSTAQFYSNGVLYLDDEFDKPVNKTNVVFETKIDGLNYKNDDLVLIDYSVFVESVNKYGTPMVITKESFNPKQFKEFTLNIFSKKENSEEFKKYLIEDIIRLKKF